MEPRKGCLIALALASAFRFFVVVVGFIVKQYKLYIIFFQRFYLYICSIPISNHTLQWNEKKSAEQQRMIYPWNTCCGGKKSATNNPHRGRPRYQIYPSTNSIRSDSVRRTDRQSNTSGQIKRTYVCLIVDFHWCISIVSGWIFISSSLSLFIWLENSVHM